MRRVLLALLLVVATGLAVVVVAGRPAPSREPSAHTALQTADLAHVTKPVPPPKPSFTRTIYATSSLARSELMLDFCRGPIAIQLGGHWPVLVAEHDYCGGSAWMPRLGRGDAVKLSGDGIVDGTYVVKRVTHGVRGKARVHDLPATDIVLQTCVAPDTMVFVGLDRFDPTVAS
jgi:hypothetical protein